MVCTACGATETDADAADIYACDNCDEYVCTGCSTPAQFVDGEPTDGEICPECAETTESGVPVRGGTTP
jgi:DNA-directed RNA polymerase subunit RPC12/RpoP